MSRLRRILPPNESSLQHRRSPRRSAGSGRSESPHSENRRTSRKYAGNRTNDRSGTASAIVAPAAVRDVERRSPHRPRTARLRSRRPLPGPRRRTYLPRCCRSTRQKPFVPPRNECPHSSPGKFQLHRCRSPLCSPPYVGGTGFRPLAAGKSRTDRPERRGTDPDVES